MSLIQLIWKEDAKTVYGKHKNQCTKNYFSKVMAVPNLIRLANLQTT